MTVLGVDVSSYQASVDWPQLKANGVEFAIVKVSQGVSLTDSMATNHLNGAKNAGMLAGLYHFMDAHVPALAQAQYAYGLASKMDFDFLCLDVEELGGIPSPATVSSTAHAILQYWAAKTTKPLVIYSRSEFIEVDATPALSWCLNYPLWLASYPFQDGRLELTWDQFKTLIPAGGPWFPKDWPDKTHKWTFWQFSGDKFITPGLGLGDYNLFNGSLDDLYKWAGKSVLAETPVQTVPQPAPVAQQPSGGLTGVVRADVLNVMAGPGINYPVVGQVLKGFTCEVNKISGTDIWVEVDPGRWICIQRGSTQYVDVK
jgi:GH25 family lysozyme M1 (1,4-beta-N-acetylmuramidase)